MAFKLAIKLPALGRGKATAPKGAAPEGTTTVKAGRPAGAAALPLIGKLTTPRQLQIRSSRKNRMCTVWRRPE